MTTPTSIARLHAAQMTRGKPVFSIDEFHRMRSGNGMRVVWQDGCELSYHDTTHEWHLRGPCGAKHVLHGTSDYARVFAHWEGFRDRIKHDLTPVAP